eukprot:COSAG02_NODE_1044_length_15004_cov_106.824287_6_plen_56_part_00
MYTLRYSTIMNGTVPVRSTVGLHGIEVSFGGGQTPRACEVRSKKWLLLPVRLGVI